MRIEHLAIYAREPEFMRDFFSEFFGAVSDSGYRNPDTGFRSYFLTFDGGARLEIMNRPLMTDAEKSPFRTGYAHMALSVGDRQRVNELTVELRNAGYEILSGPRVTGDGYYESCLLGPENIVIELTASSDGL